VRKKRYEIMSTEDVMQAFTTIPNVNSGCGNCADCIVWKNNNEVECQTSKGMLCLDLVRNFLNSTIEVKKRYELLTDDESVNRICSLYNFFYADKKKDLAEFLCEWVEDGKESI